MGYVIFSFQDGDYLRDQLGHLLIFESRGLAYQHMQVHYHNPIPTHKTKKFVHILNYYPCPFRILKAC